VCALTLHKGMTKDVVRTAGVATPDYVLVKDRSDIGEVKLPFPVFAKPIAEGTGKGISANSKISNATQLKQVCEQLLDEYRQPVLVERFLSGREFTVGILGTGQHARALATLEINLLEGADAEVYSYRNKEECEELVRYTLLSPGKLRDDIEALSLQAWRALGCRDAGRIDVRLDENERAHFLEVNPLAGIHPEHSDLPIMATMTGMDYTSLISIIMKSAMQRCEQVPHAASKAA
jgi:D-alanine-D-alanine ligase